MAEKRLTTIRISVASREWLTSLKRGRDTYDDVLLRLRKEAGEAEA